MVWWRSFKPGVFNLLSSRANLHLSYNPAGRSHCRLQNHHGYIKHHHRAWAAHQVTQVKQQKGCRMSCDVGKAAEGLENELWHRWSDYSQLILQPFHCFTCILVTSPASQFILQPFRRFIYVTAHSTTLTLLHLRPRHFTYVTWRAAHAPVMMFNMFMIL